MIESGSASFVVQSTETEPRLITEMLGLDPTTVIPKGTVARSGRVREHTWSIDVEPRDNTVEDHTGTGALAELLRLTRNAAGRVSDLPGDCDARIRWYGSSDSTQGGFVLPVELAAQIATLGVDLYATVYLEEGGQIVRSLG